MEPPYRRIAVEIAERIAAGEIAPGERVPSTRQIIERYGVAMATASKVLTELRLQGLVAPSPASAPSSWRRPPAAPGPARNRNGRPCGNWSCGPRCRSPTPRG